MSVLAQHKHTFSDHACLRLLRAKLTTALLDKLPRVVREQVINEATSALVVCIYSSPTLPQLEKTRHLTFD